MSRIDEFTPDQLNSAVHRALGWIHVDHVHGIWVQRAHVETWHETPGLVDDRFIWRGPLPNYHAEPPADAMRCAHVRSERNGQTTAWVPGGGIQYMAHGRNAAVLRCYVHLKLGKNP